MITRRALLASAAALAVTSCARATERREVWPDVTPVEATPRKWHITRKYSYDWELRFEDAPPKGTMVVCRKGHHQCIAPGDNTFGTRCPECDGELFAFHDCDLNGDPR